MSRAWLWGLLGGVFLTLCGACGARSDDDDSTVSDDDDTVGSDDDDSAGDDDDDVAACSAPDSLAQGYDPDSFVVTSFAVSGEGDWQDSPCIQRTLANDHAPNQSPGGRCVSNDDPGFMELSNSSAGGGAEDDLEVNVFLSDYSGPGTYSLSEQNRIEVRIGQENFEWVHWVAGDWGGECSITVAEGARTGSVSCADLVGRYGPELGSGEVFGVYDVEINWTCPAETPP